MTPFGTLFHFAPVSRNIAPVSRNIAHVSHQASVSNQGKNKHLHARKSMWTNTHNVQTQFMHFFFPKRLDQCPRLWRSNSLYADMVSCQLSGIAVRACVYRNLHTSTICASCHGSPKGRRSNTSRSEREDGVAIFILQQELCTNKMVPYTAISFLQKTSHKSDLKHVCSHAGSSDQISRRRVPKPRG